MRILSALLLSSVLITRALADEPQITQVRAEKVGMLWNIHVTVLHADTGWEHYADGWEVQDASGNVLAYRELMHPHVQEQPFTRSISGVVIPDGTREIFVKAHCSVNGWETDLFGVELTR